LAILSSNLNHCQNYFTARKPVKFPTKQYNIITITYHTWNVLPHHLEKLKRSNLLHFCIIECVPIKGSFQIHGGNFFLTSQTIIKISRTILWVYGVSSWLISRLLTRSTLSSVLALRGLSLPVSLSTMPVSLSFYSSLLMLLFVHRLFGNSFNNFVALCPFNRYKKATIKILWLIDWLIDWQMCDQNLIFIAENHVYKSCGDVCNYVLLMR